MPTDGDPSPKKIPAAHPSKTALLLLVLLLATTGNLSVRHGPPLVSAYRPGGSNLPGDGSNANANGNARINARTSANPRAMRGAWRSRGSSHRDLVDQLVKRGIIETDSVRWAMAAVDRGNYARGSGSGSEPSGAPDPYADRPLPIGLGQTISAPHMHAYALEELVPALEAARQQQQQQQQQGRNHRGLRVLDVGTGSGYLTACLGRWLSQPPQESAGGKSKNNSESNSESSNSSSENENEASLPPGRVFGIDVRRSLVEAAERNLRRADGDLLDTGAVTLAVGDGWEGLPEEAPFDAIHVGAAAESLPLALAAQLAVGGVLVVPIGPEGEAQVLCKIRRVGGTPFGQAEVANGRLPEALFCGDDFEATRLLGVRYVPLVKKRADSPP
ncbi:unnamed protein product [Pseudo-nitzschia multistriata]|uniref:protein-L-isoaspartate(D-aspartate) O-methyltransferase n=1 Tax=Pseudo-nitzschia multistriata TaxID=183589 RepID=A0A448Z0E1_9STRA|nr:unnamed protein product [Pseudo-nitzschia multistriata]